MARRRVDPDDPDLDVRPALVAHLEQRAEQVADHGPEFPSPHLRILATIAAGETVQVPPAMLPAELRHRVSNARRVVIDASGHMTAAPRP